MTLTLGAHLKELSDGILDLLLKTKDVKEKQRLRKQLTEAHEQTARLVDANVDAATEAYIDATASLNESIQAIREAQEDLERVAQTISKIAKAIRFVERVVETIA